MRLSDLGTPLTDPSRQRLILQEGMDTLKIERFRDAILKYWESNGRKDLPWRNTSDPWQIIIAEILLRKTTSAQVVRIYGELAVLTPLQMAAMTELHLENLLRPMGMYRIRARQIREIAGRICQADREALSDPEFLGSLPGIGRYVVNTVLCIAFNYPKPALDTNMIRVVSRVFEMKSNRSRAREDKELWRFAETLVPRDRCREFNWGVLDFANAVCTARNPRHDICSLTTICDYYKADIKHKDDSKG